MMLNMISILLELKLCQINLLDLYLKVVKRYIASKSFCLKSIILKNNALYGKKYGNLNIHLYFLIVIIKDSSFMYVEKNLQ